MEPRLTAVTLGVGDVPASARFYEALGFRRKFRATGDEIAFFEAGAITFMVWDRRKLADDADQRGQEAPGFRNTALAWNCRTPEEVDAVLAKAMAAGAGLLREAGKTDYGGYRGYFADPDGHTWEVVHAPGLGLSPDGRLIVPD